MKQFKAMAASWARSFLAAALATYTVVGLDYKAIVASGVSALLPMLIRYLNPSDKYAAQVS